MTNEELLVHIVEDWAERLLPDDLDAGKTAAAAALLAYFGGASVSEACREGRALIMGRRAHPSRRASALTLPRHLRLP